MKIKRFLELTFKLIGACLLWLAVFVAQWGFYIVGLFFTFTENWLPAIISLMFALVMEFKTFVNHRTKRRPKDILKRINIGRFNSVTVRYGRTWKPEQREERSSYQTGFDAGCDFILNLEDK